jgi:hypothetical protein
MASGRENTHIVLTFDAMLDRDRRELEQLSRIRFSAPAYGTRSRTNNLDPGADIVHTLDRRYGNQWRFDVIEQHQENDEIVVVGRLSIPAKKLSVTQSARVRIEQAPAAATGIIKGTVDGIAFSFGNAAPAQPAAATTAPEAALRTAQAMAAARCLRWFPE